ncbi:MAG TPA: methionyl-tRNA formyltransferase [Candidatus Acidoferrales bacterium]|nr:methionyl-tRNA formyltransferase [Candidatus Acidoferrales bacterium]
MPLRIVFCGTPAFGLPTLEALLQNPRFSVEAVVTQPDRPRGRGQQRAESPIKEAAVKADITVHQPEKIRAGATAEWLRQIAPDAVVIIAYGQIVSRELLEIPRLGWINLHGSLLPKYRGAAPVQRAVLAGEQKTGLTTMRIDAGLDTGPILEQREMEIRSDETAAELMARMSEIGAPMMVETLTRFERGEIALTPQDNSQASYAPPVKKEEGLIDWELPASQIYNRIRAFDPWPGTYTRFRGRLCHIWGRLAQNSALPAKGECGTIRQQGQSVLVACGQNTWLELESVRPEGRKRVTPMEFANGARLASDERFTTH